ncbi:hypothetical protein VTH06DRAFT_3138 [Thermothelomyces fergusii]
MSSVTTSTRRIPSSPAANQNRRDHLSVLLQRKHDELEKTKSFVVYRTYNCGLPLGSIMAKNKENQSIKWPPFADVTGLLHHLIAQDSHDELKSLLEMGSSQGTMPLLREQDGVYALLKLAIAHDAVSCFAMLLRWADPDPDPDPDANMSAAAAAAGPGQQQQAGEPRGSSYDLQRVYRAARRAALRDGRLLCLLYLHDQDRMRHGGGVLGDPAPLYATLLSRARSPRAVVLLARRLPPAPAASSSSSSSPGADYAEILAAQCADPYAQPAVVEMLVGLVVGTPDGGDEEEGGEEAGDGCPRLLSALCAAAGALRPAVMEVLLRHPVRAFGAVVERGVDAAAERGENPLLCALAHPLPGKPEPPVPIGSPVSESDDDDEDDEGEEDGAAWAGGVASGPAVERDQEAVVAALRREWIAETRHVAAAMYAVVRRLVELARVELGAPEHKDLLVDVLSQAAIAYALHLREFLLHNVHWLLACDHTLRERLIACSKSKPSAVAANSTASEENSPCVDGELHDDPATREPNEEQAVTVAWVRGLDPKWARGALECCFAGSVRDLIGVWYPLVTLTAGEVARKHHSGHDHAALLWELLLSDGEPASPFLKNAISNAIREWLN